MRRWLVPLIAVAAGFMPLLPAGPSVAPAYAATDLSPLQPAGGLTTPFQGDCTKGGNKVAGTCRADQTVIGALFAKVFQIATLLAGILAVLFIVYNGIQYILSAGDAAKMKAARSNILNIIIGIIIIVAAYSIIRFAQTLGGLATSL